MTATSSKRVHDEVETVDNKNGAERRALNGRDDTTSSSVVTQQPTKGIASWHFVVRTPLYLSDGELVCCGHTHNVCHVVVVVTIQEKKRTVGWVCGCVCERKKEREPFFFCPCGNECIQKE